jgi:hypothetical protein
MKTKNLICCTTYFMKALIGTAALCCFSAAWSATVIDLGFGSTTTLLPDGSVLTIDATAGPDGRVSINTKTGSASLQAPKAAIRKHHTATVLPNGLVIIWGGVDRNNQLVSQTEMFDPIAKTFIRLDNLKISPRAGHTATLLTDGRLLITGGWNPELGELHETELYDWRTGKVELLDAELQPARLGHSATLLADGRVLILGGLDEAGRKFEGASLFDAGKVRFLDVDREAAQQQLYLQNQSMPNVAASIPTPDAIDFPYDGIVALRFSKPLDPTTVNSNTITLLGPHGVEVVSVVSAEEGRLAFILPTQDMFPGARYNLFINGPKDGSGVALPFFAMGFTTAIHQIAGTVDPRLQIQAATQQRVNVAVGNAPVVGGSLAGQPNLNDQNIVDSGPAGFSVANARVAMPKSAGQQKAAGDDDDEVFKPSDANRGGKWRTKRLYPTPSGIVYLSHYHHSRNKLRWQPEEFRKSPLLSAV